MTAPPNNPVDRALPPQGFGCRDFVVGDAPGCSYIAFQPSQIGKERVIFKYPRSTDAELRSAS